MNDHTGARRVTLSVAGGMLAAVLEYATAAAHAQPNTAAQGAQQGQPAGPGRMGMMGDRQAMMANMQAQAKKLDDLVAAMNATGGTDKANRVAAVVTELVAQHKAMHARMMTMMEGGGMMPGGGAAPAPAQPATPGEHDQHH